MTIETIEDFLYKFRSLKSDETIMALKIHLDLMLTLILTLESKLYRNSWEFHIFVKNSSEEHLDVEFTLLSPNRLLGKSENNLPSKQMDVCFHIGFPVEISPIEVDFSQYYNCFSQRKGNFLFGLLQNLVLEI